MKYLDCLRGIQTFPSGDINVQRTLHASYLFFKTTPGEQFTWCLKPRPWNPHWEEKQRLICGPSHIFQTWILLLRKLCCWGYILTVTQRSWYTASGFQLLTILLLPSCGDGWNSAPINYPFSFPSLSFSLFLFHSFKRVFTLKPEGLPFTDDLVHSLE